MESKRHAFAQSVFKRYGPPVVVLSLLKRIEKQPRECLLGLEFERAINHMRKKVTVTCHPEVQERSIRCDEATLSYLLSSQQEMEIKNLRCSPLEGVFWDDQNAFQSSAMSKMRSTRR